MARLVSLALADHAQTAPDGRVHVTGLGLSGIRLAHPVLPIQFGILLGIEVDPAVDAEIAPALELLAPDGRPILAIETRLGRVGGAAAPSTLWYGLRFPPVAAAGSGRYRLRARCGSNAILEAGLEVTVPTVVPVSPPPSGSRPN